MTFKGLQVFTWTIDWSDTVNGSWQFDLRALTVGFGPELIDPKQDHIVHGFDFQTDFRESAIADIDAFLDSLEGRARPFWLPGPPAEFKIKDDREANSFLIEEQGAATGWELKPGGYLWFTKPGEEPQSGKITSIVDYGDGTELVTFEQVKEGQESSSSSVNSSASTTSSLTTTSQSSSTAAGLTTTSESSTSKSSTSTVTSSSTSQSSSSKSSVVSASYSSSNSSSSATSANSSSSTTTASISTGSSSSSYSTSSSSQSESSSSSSSAFIGVDETWRVSALVLVRLADDEEKMEVMAERWQRRAFKVVEVPHEYALVPALAIPEPSEPVFLYRFTAELPDGNIEWLYTSHPSDVTLQPADAQSSSSSQAEETTSDSLTSQSSSESVTFTSVSSSSSTNSSSTTAASATTTSESKTSTTSASSANSSSSSSGEGSTVWLAVGIEHGRISRSMKQGGTASITADYDEVEPLRLCVPMRLAAPLRVEIIKTTAALNEMEKLFDGVVRKPELVGRKVTVSCIEWGDAMEGRVPNFFIQRDCNYRVYDTATCRADKASKTYAVSIIAVSGRLAVITAAGLSGLNADWFAQGWIEYGTGLDRRTLFIAASTAPTGEQITLTLTTAITAELPVTASAVAGCDARRSTCIAKFNNLVNFGGHAPPRDNLTLMAVRSKQQTGGKK